VNRDENGNPKTITFGGEERATVSSQAWKRAMREYFKENYTFECGTRTQYIKKIVLDALNKNV